MPAAVVKSNGSLRQLGGRADPPKQIIDQDVNDPAVLARLLNEAREEIAELKREHRPRRIDFEDVVCTSASAHRLHHGFGGRVRWWVVGWTSTGTPLVDSNGDTLNVYGPMLVEDATSTTDNVLVLSSKVAGTATIRVEEAG